MNEADKVALIQELDIKFGSDITELGNLYDVENDLVLKRDHLQGCLDAANDQVPYKLSTALKKAENNTHQIEMFKERSDDLKEKISAFLDKTEPFRNVINKKFEDIKKLKDVVAYLKSFEKVEELSNELKQCNDDEQAVLIYGELRDMSYKCVRGHRASYVKEYTHYWHNVLKDRFTKQYEDTLTLLKWPFTSAQDKVQPPKDVLAKFNNITRFLLLIEDPTNSPLSTSVSGDFTQEHNPSLPVRILLKPLKKRFAFHFTGSRQTARIDRPEWFLTQTLTWIKHHQAFIRRQVQPIADKLDMKNIRAEDEFNAGLISLASERLHTVLGLYHAQGIKGEMIDVDAAFAHAVDETLGFHKELLTVTGQEGNSVLTVLTKAETFVRWLSVEKKYALAKMDESLSTDQWMEAVSSGATRGPRGADWFITLLAAIEQRYAPLPRPGHRLQFLELQLELIEEWRVRLTQLLNAAVTSLNKESFLKADDSPHPLTAVINAAHHTRTILLQWAHSLHYLQLHYYRRQFQHFTASQRRDDTDDEDLNSNDKSRDDGDENMSLKDVEVRAEKLALSEVSRRNSSITLDTTQQEMELAASPMLNMLMSDVQVDVDSEDSGVFAEAPALLAHLRDSGLTAFADHILLEFKAGLWDYKKQKWHSMPIVEEMAQSLSPCLCLPLSGLCARLHSARAKLAPSLYVKMRNHVAGEVDLYIFEEVVLESWWNTGGTMQFNHDVKRNLVPTFAPSGKVSSSVNLLPRLNESCKILNMDYEDARRLRAAIAKNSALVTESLSSFNIRHVTSAEVHQILNQRTDLADSGPPSVMELF